MHISVHIYVGYIYVRIISSTYVYLLPVVIFLKKKKIVIAALLIVTSNLPFNFAKASNYYLSSSLYLLVFSSFDYPAPHSYLLLLSLFLCFSLALSPFLCRFSFSLAISISFSPPIRLLTKSQNVRLLTSHNNSYSHLV